MKVLGNIIWVLFGGLEMGLGWFLIGVLWCITIVGIPIGKQCFKMASLSFLPFGKDVEFSGKTFPVLVNILWIVLSGASLAVSSALMGCLFCITIVGIPFGLQHFKLAKIALMPFGAVIVKKQ